MTTAIHISYSPDVLTTHRRNLTTHAAAATAWATAQQTTGHPLAITYHPAGAVVTGIHPTSPHEESAPPPGWTTDTIRRILVPDLTTTTGRTLFDTLSALEWVSEPLPGIHLPDGANAPLTHLDPLELYCGPGDLPVFGVLEAAGAIWCLSPQEHAATFDPQQWERSRRYLLNNALTDLVRN